MTALERVCRLPLGERRQLFARLRRLYAVGMRGARLETAACWIVARYEIEAMKGGARV